MTSEHKFLRKFWCKRSQCAHFKCEGVLLGILESRLRPEWGPPKRQQVHTLLFTARREKCTLGLHNFCVEVNRYCQSLFTGWTVPWWTHWSATPWSACMLSTPRQGSTAASQILLGRSATTARIPVTSCPSWLTCSTLNSTSELCKLAITLEEF